MTVRWPSRKSNMAVCVAKAALFNEHNEILILRRHSTDDNRPNDLDIPGGGVEPGENFDHAVVREVNEEVGVVLRKNELNLAYAETSMKNDENIFRLVYVGRVSKSQPIHLSHEHTDYYWFTLQQAIDKFTHPVWNKSLLYIRDNKLYDF